jgi:hypothetical protein
VPLRVPIKTMGDRPPACRATDQRSVPQSDLLGALSALAVAALVGYAWDA